MASLLRSNMQDFVQEVPVGQMAQGTPFRCLPWPIGGYRDQDELPVFLVTWLPGHIAPDWKAQATPVRKHEAVPPSPTPEKDTPTN